MVSITQIQRHGNLFENISFLLGLLFLLVKFRLGFSEEPIKLYSLLLLVMFLRDSVGVPFGQKFVAAILSVNYKEKGKSIFLTNQNLKQMYSALSHLCLYGVGGSLLRFASSTNTEAC